MSLTGDVLDTLIREDLLGIRSRGSVVDGRLRFPVGDRTASIPVRADGFLCDFAVAEPEVDCEGTRYTDLGAILALLRDSVDPADLAGFDAFTTECAAAAEAARRLAADRAAALAGISERHLRYDTLAAYAGHPVYPTGLARIGLSAADQRACAPEYHPTFRLRWTCVPDDRVTFAGELPSWWPTAAAVGGTGVPFPVHPLTGPGPEFVDVTPTLSMRTVAVLADPAVQIKVPLPTSTLGLRNRRSIKPGTLPDGAVVGRLLADVVAADGFDRVLLADEQTYAQTDDEMLAFLVRRYPRLDGEIVPLAALGARDEHDRPVLDGLADRFRHGDPTALLTEYLALLLDFHVTLLLRHGIALESHQQNVSLVLDDERIRLLYKDNDGPRLRAGLPGTELLDDRRIPVGDTAPLIDMFTTITLHLCAAAIVFPAIGMRAGSRLIRDLLAAAIDRHPDSPDRRLLIDATLRADRLPVKAMVTAGTWQSKQRSGASDINKCYRRTGPNYLLG